MNELKDIIDIAGMDGGSDDGDNVYGYEYEVRTGPTQLKRMCD